MTSADLIRAASGSCLMIRDEDVEGILAKRDAAPWARASFNALRDRMDARVIDPVEIPDRGGQWPHWYACEACGTSLVTESPTVHRCPTCGRVNSGEPWDSVPLTRVHNALSRDVMELGLTYALTRESRYARKAAEILLGYAKRYPGYPVRDHNLKSDTAWATKVSWGTLGESVWLLPVCAGYDFVRHADVFTPAEHQAIREQLLRPAARLIRKHNIGIHNIQCWHNAAIGSAALLLRDESLLEFTVFGDVGIRAQIREGVRGDGFWHEGSWGYHFYGMTPLLAWTTALRNCGLDLFDDRLRGMFEAPLSAVRPDGGLPAFHDNGGPFLASVAHHYEIAYATWGDARFAWPIVRSGREHLNGLLYGRPDLPTRVPEATKTTRLPESGFVYARQGSGKRRTYAAFDYGPHGGGHGHPDKLSFILFGRGEVQAPDPGSVAYGIPIHKAWYKQTLSHNTILVDETSQAPAEGKLQYAIAGDGFDVMRADAGPVYEGVRLNRTMVVMRDVVLTMDRVTSQESHTVDWAYHNHGAVRTSFSRKKRKTLGEGDGYEVVQDVRKGEPDGTWRATFKREGSGVRLTVLDSRRPTLVFTGAGPENPGEGGVGEQSEALVPMVLARREGRRRTTFCTALQVFGGRPVKDDVERVNVEPSDRARGFAYRSRDTTTTLICAYRPGAVAYEGGRFEGQGLLTVSGEGDRVVLCEGTELTWGKRRLTVEPAGSVEVRVTDDGTHVTNHSDGLREIALDGRDVRLAAGRTWHVGEETS